MDEHIITDRGVDYRLKGEFADDNLNSMPPYFRAFAYFCIRYFLKLGFLDGRAGWIRRPFDPGKRRVV